MRIKYFLSLFLIFLLSCNNYDIKLDATTINEIRIVRNILNGDTLYIKDKEDISTLIECLNKSRKEVSKFAPVYRVYCIRLQDTLLYNINGNGVNHKGIWYHSICNIEKRIQALIDNNKY